MKGFSEGVDYTDTFSLVGKPSTICLFLSIAFTRIPYWQVDVNNVFLHGGLVETIYMDKPASFVDKTFPYHECLLKKSLYELKQAYRLPSMICQAIHGTIVFWVYSMCYGYVSFCKLYSHFYHICFDLGLIK